MTFLFSRHRTMIYYKGNDQHNYFLNIYDYLTSIPMM